MAKKHKKKSNISAEDLFKLNLISAPTLSPNGQEVAYVVQKTDAKNNRYLTHIHCMDTRGRNARPLTQGTHQDGQPTWSPNGKWIAFVSKRDENKIPQIWILPAKGGEPYPLTDLKGGPITQLRWSPDSRTILFIHRIEPFEEEKEKKKKATYKHFTRLWYKLDGDGYLPQERRHVWTVAVPSGKTRQLTFGPFDDGGAVWHPSEKKIAFVSNRLPEPDYHKDRSDLYVISSKSNRPRPKRLTPEGSSVQSPTWSLDGKTIYYIGNTGPSGQGNKHPTHLFALNAASGNLTDLTPKMDFWLTNSNATDTASANFSSSLFPYREGREERVAYLVSRFGACQVCSIAAKGGPEREEFTGKINVVGLAVNPQSNRAVAVSATLSDTGDLYTFHLNGAGTSKRLTHINQRFFGARYVTEPEEIWFRNGSTRIQGWIIKPPGFQKNRKYPLVLEVHGGPMTQYGYTFFHEMNLLAAQGYVVVCSNPRGSDGYGTRFRSCIDKRWGTLDYEDVMSVVNTMTRKPYIDSKRLGVLGGSYGGFMTTWIVGHTKRFKAAVTMRQFGNHYAFFGTSDIGFVPHFLFEDLPWRMPQRYLKASPNFYVGRIETPLLIIHSEQDYRCPLSQSEELYTALKMRKKTVEMIQFEGESHGLSRGGKPQNRLERLNRIVNWFKRYL